MKCHVMSLLEMQNLNLTITNIHASMRAETRQWRPEDGLKSNSLSPLFSHIYPALNLQLSNGKYLR